jgi:hypothetical protein
MKKLGRKPVHGLTKTKPHIAWTEMRQRCYNKNILSFHNWGGRGIKVCDRWKNSFVNFYKDMGDPPTKGHQLDRIDNDGDYEPGNVRWATQKEQGRNRRDNVILNVDGEDRLLIDIAEEIGIRYETLYGRIRSGWSVERAVTCPPIIYNKKT